MSEFDEKLISRRALVGGLGAGLAAAAVPAMAQGGRNTGPTAQP